MKEVHRGRAAAYEALGDHERAVTDHTMLLYILLRDVEAAADKDPADRAELLKETARAYLNRGTCHAARGRTDLARQDLQAAEKHRAEAQRSTALRAAVRRP